MALLAEAQPVKFIFSCAEVDLEYQGEELEDAEIEDADFEPARVLEAPALGPLTASS